MKKRVILRKLDSDLKSGLAGLKVSLFSLIIIILVMIILIYPKTTFSEIISILFTMPNNKDYSAIFGLSIIFIVVPFVMAIKLKKR